MGMGMGQEGMGKEGMEMGQEGMGMGQEGMGMGKVQYGGRGILNEVAVPALLLYANTVYKPSKSRKVGRRSRKSRRSARRRR
jgi:hypothetical protein